LKLIRNPWSLNDFFSQIFNVKVFKPLVLQDIFLSEASDALAGVFLEQPPYQVSTSLGTFLPVTTEWVVK
jgi:hypothetical protein